MMTLYGPPTAEEQDDEVGLAEIASMLLACWKLLAATSLTAGVLALGITYLIAPTFTARTVFLPPQQQQSAAASAIASLGALSGLAGGVAGLKTPADQYVALMQSATVADRLIDRFGLMKVYDEQYRADARKSLAEHTLISVGKKDGLITVEVDDHLPQRAAEMANRYVEELRWMTNTIAVSEAQQRRMFFEQQLEQTKERLVAAQLALQSSGVSEAAIKTDAKAAAQAYANLRAQATAAEVKLRALRQSLAESAPEIQQQQALVASLKQQLALLAQPEGPQGGPDYVGKYREFKYQETLFDLFAKQYELARLDESREGALIQVIDPATAPERKSKPRRLVIAASVAGLSLLAMLAWEYARLSLGRRSGRRSALATRRD